MVVDVDLRERGSEEHESVPGKDDGSRGRMEPAYTHVATSLGLDLVDLASRDVAAEGAVWEREEKGRRRRGQGSARARGRLYAHKFRPNWVRTGVREQL